MMTPRARQRRSSGSRARRRSPRRRGWARVARIGTDDPAVFSAYLRTLRWNTATAADRDLFQAPFRAGIHLDAYQLLPLRKALRLPRVNLLIADDVGAGKTIEAGLVLREMLLRRRIDFVVVAAPAGMVRQWQDELEAKFGLSFVDRRPRVPRGPAAGARLIGAIPGPQARASSSRTRLLADETYVAGLRDVLGDFRPRALLILDEAHHAAPASGARYAIDSQFTRAVRDLADRFEHRLFLSATPHNGHSNSFSALLEILDPQRFTRGVPVRPRELDAVMVRRLKSDLRHFGERFPERIVEPIRLAGLPTTRRSSCCRACSPHMAQSIRARAAALPPRQAGWQAGLRRAAAAAAVLDRAFARDAGGASQGLDRARRGVGRRGRSPSLRGARDLEDEPSDEAAAPKLIERRRRSGSRGRRLPSPRRVADRARRRRDARDRAEAARRPDARVRWLADWIRANMAPGGEWNDAPSGPLHRIRGHAPLAGKAARRGARRSRAGRSDRLASPARRRSTGARS